MTWYGARCQCCNRPVVWTVTENGKKMPVDESPSPDGTFLLSPDDPPIAYFVRVYNRVPEELRHTSHLSTCPFRELERGA